MADRIEVYQGDARPDFSGIITFTGTVTLTGSTVSYYLEDISGTVKVSARVCTVTIDNTAKTITWSVDTESGDFDTLGKFYPYLVVTFTDNSTHTIPVYNDWIIKVNPRGNK